MPEPTRNWKLFCILPFALIVSLWNITDSLVLQLHLRESSNGSSSAGRVLQEISVDRTSGESSFDNLPTIDIISIGSLLKTEHQDAQERTFAQHPSVRNFIRITEMDDTDSSCFTELSAEQLDNIVDFCSKTESESLISQTIRQRIFKPKKHSVSLQWE